MLSLADSDKFVLLMNSAPAYDLRFQSICFKHTYKDEIRDLNIRVDKVYNFFDFMMTSNKFYKWLELILAYGNYLNGGGNKYIKITKFLY